MNNHTVYLNIICVYASLVASAFVFKYLPFVLPNAGVSSLYI